MGSYAPRNGGRRHSCWFNYRFLIQQSRVMVSISVWMLDDSLAIHDSFPLVLERVHINESKIIANKMKPAKTISSLS